MNLRAKASIVLCILITITVCSTGFLYLYFLEKSLHKAILNSLSGISDTSAQSISRFLSDTLTEAKAIALALPKEALENQNADLIEKTLEKYFSILPKFENGMFILDARGQLWTDYPKHQAVRGKSFAYRQYFQRTMAEGRGIVGTPYRSARTGKPVLTFTAVLKDRSGNMIGMLGCSAQLTSENALEGIRLTKMGESGYLYVYNSDRLMILHPNEKRILKTDVPPGVNKLYDAALKGFEGTGETINSRGIHMLISMKHIPGTDWVLGCQQPQAEAYAPIIDARKRIIAIILLAAFGAVLLGFFLMKKITTPLARLREASQLIERVAGKEKSEAADKAELKRRFDGIPDNGELGDLKNAFIKMHEKLDATMVSLKKSATDWINTFDSVKDAVFLLDNEKRIVRLNKAALQFIQKPEKEAIGAYIGECKKDIPEGVFKGEAGSDSEREGFILESQSDDESRRLAVFEISCTPLIDEAGSRIGTILIGKDISLRVKNDAEKSRLEKKLLKAKKMEAIGTLAGGVAHDLNNILSGILSYPELILLQLPDDSELRKPMETIMQSGIKASTIVQDLLTLARRGIASNEVLDLNDIINEYLSSPEFEKLKFHHPAVEEKTILDPDLLPVEGSRIHLLKTVMNLVSNAAEAMPEGGKVTLSTRNQNVGKILAGYEDIRDGDYVVLTVKDEGLGIVEEDLEKVFEPFYTKKVMGRSGTGLGMSVVWGTVKDHHGHIDVQSEFGSWTEFTIYLPASGKELKPVASPVDLSELTGTGEFILVIDDLRDQRLIAVSMLKQLGYSADSVSSGSEAIVYWKNKAPDLLILDMIMPNGMDGYETYKEAIKINPGQKAIIASGFSETESVKKTLALGASAYIRKPYTIESIGLAVKKALSE